MTLAVYPGTLDPITNGHLDMIRRAHAIFDQIHVAVVDNPNKDPLFSVERRVELLHKTVDPLEKVSVGHFDGLLVDYVESMGANVILRGLRALSDFEYEFQMSLMNKRLNQNIETVYMMTGEQHSFVSSSIVKEVARLGGDISSLVPRPVEEALMETVQDD